MYKITRVMRELGLDEATDVIYTSDHGDNLDTRGLWGKSTMYDKTAAVPLIAPGPSFPKGRIVDTPASHVDAFPSIIASAGESFESVTSKRSE